MMIRAICVHFMTHELECQHSVLTCLIESGIISSGEQLQITQISNSSFRIEVEMQKLLEVKLNILFLIK